MINQHAPWSLSKSDLAAKCPYAFKLRYVDRVGGASGTAAKIGVTAHLVEEYILRGQTPQEALHAGLTESPDLTHAEIATVEALMPALAAFYERMQRFHVKHDVVEQFFEQKWAINRQYEAVDWDDPTAFFRGIVDYAMLTRGGYLVVVDHKSGRNRGVDYYSRQLDAYAVLGLAQMPNIKGVHAALHYMKTQDLLWHLMRRRSEIAGVLRSALGEMLLRRANGLHGYVATPNSLCKWCDYVEACDVGSNFIAEAELLKKAKRKKVSA